MDTTSYLLGKKAGGGSGGTSNYNELTNKPSINGVELAGNKSTSNLGIYELITENDIDSLFPEPTPSSFYIYLSGGSWSGEYPEYTTTDENIISEFLGDISYFSEQGTFDCVINDGETEYNGYCEIVNENTANWHPYEEGTSAILEYKEIEEQGEYYYALVLTYTGEEE